MSAEIASYPPKPGHLIWYDVHTRYGSYTATCLCGWQKHHPRHGRHLGQAIPPTHRHASHRAQDPVAPPIGDLMGRHTDYTADWPVPARWPADCPECHQPWQPGDAIVRDGGRWVHHQCPDREDT